MNVTLYELANQHLQLNTLADSDDIPPEVIRDTLDGLEGTLRDKAVSVAHFVRNLEEVAATIDNAAAAMLARADRLRTRAGAVRDYLLFNMQAVGISKIESPYFTLAVRDNPLAVVIDDESAIPDAYKVQPPPPPRRIDRAAIAKAIKDGQAVPGCHGERRQRLEIKL